MKKRRVVFLRGVGEGLMPQMHTMVDMLTPTFFHIFFCLSNVFFSTRAFTPVYHTGRMHVFAFNFK